MQAACQDVRRFELLPNLRRSYLLVAVRQHRRAREDVQPFDLGKFGDDVFGHAVAKVLVFLHSADVLEIQHRYGFHALFAACARFA
jgi:hypothetical protein